MTGDVLGLGVVTIRVKDPLNAEVNHKITQQPHLQSSQTTLELTKNTIICNLTKHQFSNIAAGLASGSVLGLHSLMILYLDVMVNEYQTPPSPLPHRGRSRVHRRMLGRRCD